MNELFPDLPDGIGDKIDRLVLLNKRTGARDAMTALIERLSMVPSEGDIEAKALEEIKRTGEVAAGKSFTNGARFAATYRAKEDKDAPISIEAIRGKKIAVHCATEEEAYRVGFLLGRSKAFVDCALDDFEDAVCYSIDNEMEIGRICYDSKEFYTDFGYVIIPSTKVIA